MSQTDAGTTDAKRASERRRALSEAGWPPYADEAAVQAFFSEDDAICEGTFTRTIEDEKNLRYEGAPPPVELGQVRLRR